MNLTILAAIFLAANLALTAAIFWHRYLSNPQLFKTDRPLKPIQTRNKFFRPFNGLFDFLDRIPFLRRSGTANEFDLFKALVLVSVPLLAIKLITLQPTLAVALISIGILHMLITLLLLAHPVTKRLTR